MVRQAHYEQTQSFLATNGLNHFLLRAESTPLPFVLPKDLIGASKQ
jgi:hypothetical protein